MGSLKPWGCNDITSYRTNFWTCWIWCPRSVDNFPRDLQLAFFGGSESGSHKCCGAVHRLWEVCLALGVESQFSLLLNLLYNLILRQQRLPLIRLQPNNSNNWLWIWIVIFISHCQCSYRRYYKLIESRVISDPFDTLVTGLPIAGSVWLISAISSFAYIYE